MTDNKNAKTNLILRSAGYVKLAKLWERSKESAIQYHNEYYAEKFKDNPSFKLCGVFIDITGKKEICKRPEMLRLLRECYSGQVDCIFTQTKAYLAANTEEFCYLLKFLFTLPNKIDIITEDRDYNINTLTDDDGQRAALLKMSDEYILFDPQHYTDWKNKILTNIEKL